MIAIISGKLLKKSPDYIIIDVNGVGYGIHIPLSTYCALPGSGEAATLQIHTHIREDAFKLFGFLTTQEQFLFEKLISISKIGPKLALGILSGIPAGELEAAVVQSDIRRLSSIPGVGKKTAERLVIELKDKIKLPISTISQTILENKGSSDPGVFNDALSALVNLGFSGDRAEKAIAKVYHGKPNEEWDIEQLIKESLKVLV